MFSMSPVSLIHVDSDVQSVEIDSTPSLVKEAFKHFNNFIADDVSSTDFETTALHIATKTGNSGIVKSLLNSTNRRSNIL